MMLQPHFPKRLLVSSEMLFLFIESPSFLSREFSLGKKEESVPYKTYSSGLLVRHSHAEQHSPFGRISQIPSAGKPGMMTEIIGQDYRNVIPGAVARATAHRTSTDTADPDSHQNLRLSSPESASFD